ncbi:glucose-1-phosphate adenylyltransferase family protein [Roseisolibacter agri]|uniref:Glucose-1-phosphate adenylyltransferase n=1 Tax=Roseisolibacter agri TaxID=2014610 RepID=A0AA37V509_9BACT|nr:sugar phosphate nucleotidyltransferase [Roseisolibacter agri]GLC23501.1 glucose-1-phosphate adenylyltransferase [Roseisolibacter agri]
MASRPRTLALVLAGGKGSRLGPLTQRRAKPALPFGGGYRMIDFPLTNCVHSGLSDVWVVEQYQPHALNDHLLNGRPWDLDRNQGGLRILPPFTGAHGEGFAGGNADALWRHRALLAESGADELVVLSADHVERVDLRDVLDAHREARASVTMVTTEVARDEASRFGVVHVAAGGRVQAFDYKPEHPPGDGARVTVTTEVFAYDLQHLLATLDALAAEVERRDDVPHLQDFGDHLLPALVREGRAHCVPHAGYWRDLGTPGSYWRGHMDLLGDEPALVVDDPAWPVRTAAAQLMPARVSRGAELADALLAPGAYVAGRVARSVLGPGAIVEAGAEVHDSVLLHGAVVRRGARVVRAVLDDGVEVGAGAVVGGAGEGDDAITVVGMGARVDAGERLAAGATRDAARRDAEPR